MKKKFEFTDGWRTYTCHIEKRVSNGTSTNWWWFAVTGDAHTYAPFAAAADDTEDNVRERILAFHNHRLARRAEPPAPRYQQTGRPPNKVAAQKKAEEAEEQP